MSGEPNFLLLRLYIDFISRYRRSTFGSRSSHFEPCRSQIFASSTSLTPAPTRSSRSRRATTQLELPSPFPRHASSSSRFLFFRPLPRRRGGFRKRRQARHALEGWRNEGRGVICLKFCHYYLFLQFYLPACLPQLLRSTYRFTQSSLLYTPPPRLNRWLYYFFSLFSSLLFPEPNCNTSSAFASNPFRLVSQL